MGRVILGIAASVVAAFVTIAIVEYLGSLIFPQPAPLDSTEQVAVDD